MPRTLGADMPTATPTEKNYTDIYQTCFEKNCYENVVRMICVGLAVWSNWVWDWKRIFHRKILTYVNLYRPSKTDLNNFWFFVGGWIAASEINPHTINPQKSTLRFFFRWWTIKIFAEGGCKFYRCDNLTGFESAILFTTTWTKNKPLFKSSF